MIFFSLTLSLSLSLSFSAAASAGPLAQLIQPHECLGLKGSNFGIPCSSSQDQDGRPLGPTYLCSAEAT